MGERPRHHPHALIATFGGDTVAAGAPCVLAILIALVDFDNDSVATALACAREYGERLWGVAGHLQHDGRPRAVVGDGDFVPTGVNRRLVEKVRKALDDHGFGHVRVIVSAASTGERIAVSHRGPGRLLRRRLLPAQGQRRLHRRRGPARGPPAKVGRVLPAPGRSPVDLTAHRGAQAPA